MNYSENNDTFDTSKAWNNLHKRLQTDGLLQSQTVKVNWLYVSKIAATFLLVIIIVALSYFGLNVYTTSNMQVVSTKHSDSVKEHQLPDGSIAYLNSNSSLHYPTKFSSNMRVVEFEGDGFFEITKNAKKPFTVKLKNANVTVIGTSFSVNTNAKEQNIEVFVKTGKVLFRSDKFNDSKLLEAGYIGRLNNGKIIKIKNTDVNYLAWKTGILNFSDVPFDEIVKVLERVYKVDIKYDKSLISNLKLVAPLQHKKLDTVLKIICAAKNLEYTQKAATIYLKPKNLNNTPLN